MYLPNWYFNVPVGYDDAGAASARRCRVVHELLQNLRLLWYAGAGISLHTWNEPDDMAVETTGERVTMLTGLGSTETAPFAMAADQTMVDAGMVGLPARGCEFKLVPVEEKFEARVRGPNVTPGYWRQPELTRSALRQRRIFIVSATRCVSPTCPNVNKGFYFDGRLAEAFKLSTGTWVAVGPLRAALINHCAPYVQDVVVAGLDRDHIAVLIFANLDACRKLIGRSGASLSEVAADDAVRRHFARLLESFAGSATGSSNRVVRAACAYRGTQYRQQRDDRQGILESACGTQNRAAIVEALYERGEGDILGLPRR